MKKTEKIVVISSDSPTLGAGILLPQEASQRLIGRLCTIVETLGLHESQENALKSLVKQEVYYAFSHDAGARWINATLYEVLREALTLEEEVARGLSVPPGLLGTYELTWTPSDGRAPRPPEDR